MQERAPGWWLTEDGALALQQQLASASSAAETTIPPFYGSEQYKSFPAHAMSAVQIQAEGQLLPGSGQ
jgi:hypothetical protein